MSISTDRSRVIYEGNGAARSFSFDFKVWDTAQIRVVEADESGTETDVTGKAAVELSATGGTVTLPEPLARGHRLAVFRSMPFLQEDRYLTGTRFDAHEIEDALDVACAERQELREKLGRAVVTSITDARTPEMLLQDIFDAEANARDAMSGAQAAQQKSEQARDAAKKSADAAAALESVKSEVRAEGEAAAERARAAVQAKGDEQAERLQGVVDDAKAYVDDAAERAEASADESKFYRDDLQKYLDVFSKDFEISDAVNSSSSTTAASSKAVKTAYDKAAAALPLAGGTMTGGITFNYNPLWLIRKDTGYALGEEPGGWRIFNVAVRDRNNQNVTQLFQQVNAEGVTSIGISATNPGDPEKSAYLAVWNPKEGTPFATCTAPNPDSSDNTNKIATTSWVQTVLKDKSMPVGSMYMQLGTAWPIPQTLFGGTWQNVSSDYAGRFFRVEGGNAASFDKDQAGGAPNITGASTAIGWAQVASASTGAFYDGSPSSVPSGGAIDSFSNIMFSAQRSNALYNINEIRPINHSIRIWKRIA